MNNCTKKLFRVSPGLRRVDNETLVVEGKDTRTHLKEEDDEERGGTAVLEQKQRTQLIVSCMQGWTLKNR